MSKEEEEEELAACLALFTEEEEDQTLQELQEKDVSFFEAKLGLTGKPEGFIAKHSLA